MPVIDFHTHSSFNNSKTIAIQCIDINNSAVIEEGKLYSIGIHPWDADALNFDEEVRKLESILLKQNVIAVGEIGLDKLKSPSIDIQKKVFTRQLDIAYSLKKPIVIHCVKAWQDLFEIRKRYPNTLPWAIHGFNGNEQLVKQLIEKGFYLSCGFTVTNPRSRVAASFAKIPLNKLFLETDISEIKVDELYAIVAKRFNLSVSNLEEKIHSNFKEFFSINNSG
jgi:TatD DNase family protein